MPKTESFNKLMESVKKTYLGDEVPKEFRNKHGKIYNKKDIEPLTIAIAKSRGIKIDNTSHSQRESFREGRKNNE